MAIRIIGQRSFGQDFIISLSGLDFEQEQFDYMFDSARQLAHSLREEGINPKTDFGEDMLLLALAELSIREYDSINHQLCHVAYRMADNEIECNRKFDNIHFQYD